jgi:hypothetical protein
MKLIGEAVITPIGKSAGFYNVYEVEPGIYFTHPRPGIVHPVYGPDHVEFYFTKQKTGWKAEPLKMQAIALDLVEELKL